VALLDRWAVDVRVELLVGGRSVELAAVSAIRRRLRPNGLLPPAPFLRVISPSAAQRFRAFDARVRSHPHSLASATTLVSSWPALRNQFSAASLSSGGMELKDVVIELLP
jgi:hypothetical protein